MPLHRRKFMQAAAALSIALAAAPALAAPSARQALAAVNGYLNGFRTLSGEFTQVSPRGRVSTGKLYIARPGRMRFEYAPPNPYVIVSDGVWVAIRNNARDHVEYYPLSKTPLRIILARRVNLARDAIIRKVEVRDGLAVITLKDRDKLVPGDLTLVYDLNANRLQQWIVIDGQGRRTTVTLGRLRMNAKLSDKLFRVKKPGSGPTRRVRQNFSSGKR
ncbi:MAG TPA: outer membrane lipoprotein carrier protein LolA [Thermopetrobacter sp.]|nr:outer membrane lipoprotein carrier protein LolA [Thermopetrobacter sp.]